MNQTDVSITLNVNVQTPGDHMDCDMSEIQFTYRYTNIILRMKMFIFVPLFYINRKRKFIIIENDGSNN